VTKVGHELIRDMTRILGD